jgi:dipeptidyl aminopeptidase/acylaminoacyl peptidase
MDVQIGGRAANSFRFDELNPIRGPSGWSWPGWIPGIPLSLNIFGPAFGDDPQARAQASPINHVRPGLPPFLLISAEKDLPTLPGMAEKFQQALSSQGNEVHFLRVAHRNHNSIMFHAIELEDPVARVMVEFVRQHSDDR